MTESEVWKDVIGFEGFYKVSNKGNVYSVGRKHARGVNRGGRILKPVYDKDGYSRVSLYKNGIVTRKRTHRVVAEAFIPNPNGFPQVNHRDEVKDNNNVENLEWCDARYNSNYGTRNIRKAQAKSKKIRAVNIKTNEAITFNSVKEAGYKGYSNGAVSRACRGTYKTITGKLIGDGRTYKGYRWEYYEEEENKSK